MKEKTWLEEQTSLAVAYPTISEMIEVDAAPILGALEETETPMVFLQAPAETLQSAS